MGIDEIQGVILMFEQLIEHLSLLPLCRRLGTRCKLVKVDEAGSVIACIVFGLGEWVLGRRDRYKGAKVGFRIGRAVRRRARAMRSGVRVCNLNG